MEEEQRKIIFNELNAIIQNAESLEKLHDMLDDAKQYWPIDYTIEPDAKSGYYNIAIYIIDYFDTYAHVSKNIY